MTETTMRDPRGMPDDRTNKHLPLIPSNTVINEENTTVELKDKWSHHFERMWVVLNKAL